MPVKKTAKKAAKKKSSVHRNSMATTRCAQKLGARGGRKTQAKKRAAKRRK